MLTVYQHITQSKRRSWLLVLLFPATIFLWFYVGAWGYWWFSVGSYKYDKATDSLVRVSRAVSVMDLVNQTMLEILPWLAAAVVIWMLVSYFCGDKMLMYFSAATEVTRNEEPEAYRLTENLCISQGMSMPRLCVINDRSLNAFAVGRDPQTAAIVLTRGIIDKLERVELEGVIAHELAHIQNNDTRLMLLAVVYVSFFTFLSEVCFHWALLSAKRVETRHGRPSAVVGAAAFAVLGVFLAVYGFLVAPLVRLALSRTREYLADASAALMTRHPLALASALQKISKDPRVEILDAHASMSAMCIADPLDSTGVFGFLAGLRASHPPAFERIRRLREM